LLQGRYPESFSPQSHIAHKEWQLFDKGEDKQEIFIPLKTGKDIRGKPFEQL
jgi:hypothetical protein